MRTMNVLLNAVSGETTQETEIVENLFSGMPNTGPRPVMHPYGYASRAPKGITNVVGRQGESYSNRFVLGHRDSNRPGDLNVGEVCLYSSDGTTVLKKIYVRSDTIQLGSSSAANNLVLGDLLNDFLSRLLDLIINHTHIGNLGYATSPPLNSADFVAIKATDVTSEIMLSDTQFTEK